MKFDKILIPLDGSRFAEAALPKAVELVRDNPDAAHWARQWTARSTAE